MSSASVVHCRWLMREHNPFNSSPNYGEGVLWFDGCVPSRYAAVCFKRSDSFFYTVRISFSLAASRASIFFTYLSWIF